MIKVYVLSKSIAYEWYETLGVFSTVKLAQDFVKQSEPDYLFIWNLFEGTFFADKDAYQYAIEEFGVDSCLQNYTKNI